MNNLPDLIFLPLNWNSTDFSRVTRLAEKKKSRSGEHSEICIKI